MLQSIFFWTWVLLQLLVGYHLVFPFFLFLFHLIVPKKKTEASTTSSVASYAIIVTAFEQTTGLHAVVNSLLQLNYTDYLIYLVADKCDVSGLHFNDERVIVLRPEEPLCSNTRSHFYAIRHFRQPHERLTIIDSDNLVKPDYLQQLNVFFDKGFKAVQGIRNAKNLNTELACLDAARDIYYHYYDGALLFGVGSSATLSGSGMAFTTALYQDCLGKKDVTGAGFDKVLQAEILKRDQRIAFTENAIVYDEKTSRSDQLVNQRSRWINTWFKYFFLGFDILFMGIKNFSFNQFLFGLVLLRPPLFIMLGLGFFLMVLNLFIYPVISVFWLIGFALFVTGFTIALLHSKTDKRIYKSLVNIPTFIFYQVISLFNARNANKRSIATKHYHHTDVEDITTK